MTATWRKQPPIASRMNRNVRNQPVIHKTHTCRRCDQELEDRFKYCYKHYMELSELEKDNLRRLS